MANTREGRHAILPESAESATLDTMRTGETAWTTPWAMWVDSERQCWLHPKYPADEQPGGTVEMRVQLCNDGYHVWLVPGHGYTPSKSSGFASADDLQHLPVVQLHTGEGHD